MDDYRYLDERRALDNRIESAADRIFEAATRLLGEVNQADAREGKYADMYLTYADLYRVGAVTKWRWRRLEKLHVHAFPSRFLLAITEVISDPNDYRVHPTGSWRRRRQLRQLLSVAEYFERVATQLEGAHSYEDPSGAAGADGVR